MTLGAAGQTNSGQGLTVTAEATDAGQITVTITSESPGPFKIKFMSTSDNKLRETNTMQKVYTETNLEPNAVYDVLVSANGLKTFAEVTTWPSGMLNVYSNATF